MKKTIITVFVLFWTVASFAQGTIWRETIEIASVEINNGDVNLAVLNMPEEGQNQYYICVGTLGFGDDFVQVGLDPVSQLFIPLGGTLDEAQARLEEIKDFAMQEKGTVKEIEGVLAVGNPSMGELETVYMTARRYFVSRLIEFSVQRNGYVRATHVSKGDMGSLLSSMNLYRKIHPNEK